MQDVTYRLVTDEQPNEIERKKPPTSAGEASAIGKQHGVLHLSETRRHGMREEADVELKEEPYARQQSIHGYG